MQLSLFEHAVLEGVNQAGTTTGCYEITAQKVGLSSRDLQERTYKGRALVGKWQHKIRHVQQKLKSKGLVHNTGRNKWELTEAGKKSLVTAPARKAKLFFVTRYGMSFWGDSSVAAELFAGEIELIFTSPPYLLSKPREYQNIGNSEAEYVSGMVKAIEQLLPCLTSTGSVVLNIGNSAIKGAGYQSLYKERLLISLEDELQLHLVQKFVWISPSKMPTGYWVTQAKRDVVDVTEDIYWLSLNPKSKTGINQKVLVEYSEAQKRYIESATRKSPTSLVRKNPSGQYANESTFYRGGDGAIPSNLLFATPEGANSEYSLYCRENGLPRHPAMFSGALPSFFIQYLTEKEDVVLDPYFGSGVTGAEAEKLERHWVGFEVVKEYVLGQKGRFQNNGFSLV